MRIASIVHATFAATMIGLGIAGLLRPDFAPVWNPVPTTVPARELLLYLGALTSLTCGICLLVQRVAIIAARLLLATLLLWLMLLRLPNFLHAPAFARLLVGVSARGHVGCRLGPLCLACRGLGLYAPQLY